MEKTTLNTLKELRSGLTEGEKERMVEAVIAIAQRLSNIDEEDLTRAEKQIVSDLETIIQ